MRIAIGNISDTIKKDEFSAVIRAISRQVHEDFAPLWGMTATLRHATIGRKAKPDPELNNADVIIYVGETNDDPQKVENAIGYHSQNHRAFRMASSSPTWPRRCTSSGQRPCRMRSWS
jgi:hypothetical protein